MLQWERIFIWSSGLDSNIFLFSILSVLSRLGLKLIFLFSNKSTKILENSFNTKNIDVPTSDQDRDIVQNADIDFDSLEVQSILENIDTLFGYDDFRDDFDRYPINTSLDSFQWMKKYSYVAERMQKFRTDRELKLLSNVPLIRKHPGPKPT